MKISHKARLIQPEHSPVPKTAIHAPLPDRQCGTQRRRMPLVYRWYRLCRWLGLEKARCDKSEIGGARMSRHNCSWAESGKFPVQFSGLVGAKEDWEGKGKRAYRLLAIHAAVVSRVGLGDELAVDGDEGSVLDLPKVVIVGGIALASVVD